MAKSVDPEEQSANQKQSESGSEVCFGSALFAYAYLSQNLGFLR